MLRPNHFASVLIAATVSVYGPVACSKQDTAPPSGTRGVVVSTTPLERLSTEQITAYLAEEGVDTPVRNDVDAYRIVYTTIAHDGSTTTASGLLVLPRSTSQRLRVVSYAHGTIAMKKDAPSADGQTPRNRAVAIMFAATGFAAVAPDYLGLGEGPGFHPYHHVPTEVSASIDLLRAARTVAIQQQREFDPDVLVTGASQGGTAATGLAKALHSGQAPGFGLAAAAPIAGAYALEHVDVPAGLDGRLDPVAAVFYFSYWITQMNRIYHFYDKPSEAFQEPYAAKVEGLFDGQHSEEDIVESQPATLQQLLTPHFIDRLRRPTGPVLKAMTDTDDTCDWTPHVPVHLYHSIGDRDVVYANSEACLRSFRGDKVTLTNMGDVDHETGIRLAFMQILTEFLDTYRP